MSETPRTDGESKWDALNGWWVPSDFSRTLERELAAAHAASEALQPGIDHLRETCDALERERNEAREEVEFRMADSVALIAAQERIRQLEMDLAEKERPLDAEMARLNQNLIAANERAIAAEIKESALRAEVEKLRAALLALTDAADDVGVEFFDMEDPPIAVAQMQSATLAARAALQEPTP